MRSILTIATLFILCISASAETKIRPIQKVRDGVYLMYFDTTANKHSLSKSMIVEFSNFIALIEMPISTDGAGAKNLRDDTVGGEDVLKALAEYFPKKPLKYVLSSHWHPHSISSIKPFISRHITVVTTPKNFEVLQTLLDSPTLKSYGKYICLLYKDSLAIKDKSNSIIAYKFSKADYPHASAEEFIYFFMPKYNILHSSCMYQRLGGKQIQGKELISTRVEDLSAFLSTKKIKPSFLVTTDTWFDEPNGMVSGDTLQMMLKNGIGMTTLESGITALSNEVLVTKMDSILKWFISDGMPVSILNSAVYNCLAKKDLQKALAIARLQALYYPAAPNSWDTFGEAYYFLGETDLAKRCEAHSKRIDKTFTQGGEASWKANLETHRKKWKQ